MVGIRTTNGVLTALYSAAPAAIIAPSLHSPKREAKTVSCLFFPRTPRPLLFGGGYYQWFDAAAVRRQELCGEGLVDRRVDRPALGRTCHGRVAGSAEVLRVRQLEIDVSLRGHTLARAGGVIRDAVGSLNFVADAALRTRSSLVRRCQIVAQGRSSRETGLGRDRANYAHRSDLGSNLRLPEARLDGEVGELRV